MLSQEPEYGKAYTIHVGLTDAANPTKLKVNPTLVVTDCKVCIDGGAFNQSDNAPAVSPPGGVSVSLVLSAEEMKSKVVRVLFSDPDNEWADLLYTIETRPASVQWSSIATGAGANNTIVDSALVGKPAGFCVGREIKIHTGIDYGDAYITAFDSGTFTFTFAPALPEATVLGVPYEVLNNAPVDLASVYGDVAGKVLSDVRAITNQTLNLGNTQTAPNFDAFFQNSGSGTVKVVDDVGGGGGTGTTTIDIVASASATSGQVAGELNDYLATQERGDAEWWVQSSANNGTFQADLTFSIGGTLGPAGWNAAVIDLAARTQPGSGGVGNFYFYDYTNTQWDTVSYGQVGESDTPISVNIIIPTNKRADFTDPVTGNMLLRCEVTGIKNNNYFYWDFCETAYVDGDVEVLTAQEIAQVTNNLLSSEHGAGDWTGNIWDDGYIGDLPGGNTVVLSQPLTLPASAVPLCYFVSGAADGSSTFRKILAYDGDLTLTLNGPLEANAAVGDRVRLLYLSVNVENIEGEDIPDANPINANVTNWIGAVVDQPLMERPDLLTGDAPLSTTPAGVLDEVATVTNGAKAAELALVKAKTDLIPADPTSETMATANKDVILARGAAGPWTTGTAATATSRVDLIAPTAEGIPEVTPVTIYLHAFAKDHTGAPIDFDAAPTWSAKQFDLTDMSGNFGVSTNPDVGHYIMPYTIDPTHDKTEVIFGIAGEIATDPRSDTEVTAMSAATVKETIFNLEEIR